MLTADDQRVELTFVHKQQLGSKNGAVIESAYSVYPL